MRRVFSSRFGGKRRPMASARNAHWRSARGRRGPNYSRYLRCLFLEANCFQKCHGVPLAAAPTSTKPVWETCCHPSYYQRHLSASMHIELHI
ncbi:unnamed protein product [Arctia plantaginis]|uniref:Uncharacterized protein n=1 Tax=Arctia plantaginis TaxID=874455 RepID=A0A8S0ZMD7_ARCPL|nr:unnamed protein product [Arctia plantaginis]